MKPILRIAVLAAAVLMILPGFAPAATDYYIGADSKQALEQAHKANPENYAVNYFLGQIYLAEGNRDAAINAWETYLASAPDDGRSTAIRERMTLLKLARAREFARNSATKGDTTPVTPPANTIAVTDFKNLGSAKLVPFIKGLTAMITSDLAKVPQVRVLERAKIQALMKEMELGLASGIVDANTAPKLGKMIQAGKVAWGKMDTPDGTNLKITSIVTEIIENTDLQETDAEGAMTQFFKLQKKLVFGILQGMGIEKADLPPSIQKAIDRPHTTSVDALVQFGMGIDFLDNYNFIDAKQAFSNALDIDPSFDLANQAEISTPAVEIPAGTSEINTGTALAASFTPEEDESEIETHPTYEKIDSTPPIGTTTPEAGTSEDTSIAADSSSSGSTEGSTSTSSGTEATITASQTGATQAISSTLWDGPGHWHAATILVVTESRWTENVYVGDSNGPNISQHNIPSINQAGKNMVFNQDTDTMVSFDTHYGTVTVNQVMTFSADGHDEWIEYGRWNLPATTFTDGTYHYAFAGPGWYVDGATFDTTALSGTGSYTYSGSAKGSLYTHSSDSVTDLSGSFSCIADFNNNEINNFEMNLNGSDVVISGGSGIFAGSGADPYGFVITPSSISIKGETPFNASVRGTVYGDTNVGGKYVGGTFGTYGSNYSTAGYFVGEQQGSVAAAAP